MSLCFYLAMATQTLNTLCREKALSILSNGSMIENSSSCSSIQGNQLANIKKLTTIFRIVRLEYFVISVFKRKKVLTLDSRIVKGYSLDIQTRYNTLRAQKVQKRFFLVITLFLTTIIVNSKNLKKSIQNPILPPSIQDSSQHTGRSLNSLNLLSRANFKAEKQVYSRKRSQTYYIVRYSSKSVFISSVSRNPSPEVLSFSFSNKSKKESVGSNSKILTVPRVIIDKLSFKRLSLKLPTAFSKGKAFTMSQNN